MILLVPRYGGTAVHDRALSTLGWEEAATRAARWLLSIARYVTCVTSHSSPWSLLVHVSLYFFFYDDNGETFLHLVLLTAHTPHTYMKHYLLLLITMRFIRRLFLSDSHLHLHQSVNLSSLDSASRPNL